MIVPRELYLYWHQGWRRSPDIVKRCAKTWTTQNPSWTVNLLDKDTIEKRITIPFSVKALNLPLSNLSDFIRLICLKQRGGVWADATLWCARPLEDPWTIGLNRYVRQQVSSAMTARQLIAPLLLGFWRLLPITESSLSGTMLRFALQLNQSIVGICED